MVLAVLKSRGVVYKIKTVEDQEPDLEGHHKVTTYTEMTRRKVTITLNPERAR